MVSKKLVRAVLGTDVDTGKLTRDEVAGLQEAMGAKIGRVTSERLARGRAEARKRNGKPQVLVELEEAGLCPGCLVYIRGMNHRGVEFTFMRVTPDFRLVVAGPLSGKQKVVLPTSIRLKRD